MGRAKYCGIHGAAGDSEENMIIREAGINDLQGILQLYLQLNPSEHLIEYEVAKRIWIEQIESQQVRYFVAEEGDAIVSSCYIAIIPNLTRHGMSIGYLENLITDLGHRRRGIARQLLFTAIEYAKNSNCYKVVLQSGNSRHDAHLLYGKVGFIGNSKKGFELRF